MEELIPKSAEIPNSDFVIIGGTGDLAFRKIYPALFWRFISGQINKEFRIFSIARSFQEKDQFSKILRPFCKSSISSKFFSENKWNDFLKIIKIIKFDILSDEPKILKNQVAKTPSKTRPFIVYLAISPNLFADAVDILVKANLNNFPSRLVVEKPLGQNFSSAKKINSILLSAFEEKQIYRIDHYLGKETVQNLMALRFANTIFENQWNNNGIDNIQITVSETIGVKGREEYYDNNGALRDMVQNHLFQLLCLVAMEPPSIFEADQVRDEKLRVLKAVRKINKNDVILAQYKSLQLKDRSINSYIEDIGALSNTETFVALKVHIDNWRWAGVPFYLRTGKRLSSRASEIVITFKDRPHDIFKSTTDKRNKGFANRLIIRLQPQEGLRLQLTSKEPGPGGMRLYPSELNLSFNDAFDQRLPDAYERLLMDVARGNQTLFMRLDEVLAAWNIIDPIMQDHKNIPPIPYNSGSMGPPESSELLKKDGREWINPKK